MNVAHVIVNNLGGITSLTQNLILFKGANALDQELILLDIEGNPNTPAKLDEKLKSQKSNFHIHPLDNWYYTYGNLAKSLSQSEGVLVSNDQYDLIMLQAFNIPRKVVQLVHDPYNVELSLKFHDVIDHFIAHSEYIYNNLIEHLPQRATDITYLPYGIPLYPPVQRILQDNDPLKLVFLGRHDKAKGVYDLYEIDKILREKNIHVEWLILGKGPETMGLHMQWKDQMNVKFETPETEINLISKLSTTDVMVFPTKFEGFPVSLLESMSQGCVPVVTDLPGGIRELVTDGITGFKCSINNNKAFADAIEKLHINRDLLLKIKNNVINIIFEKYNAIHQSPCYQEIFRKIATTNTSPRHHVLKRKIGSRLDHPLFPNIITRSLRKLIKSK